MEGDTMERKRNPALAAATLLLGLAASAAPAQWKAVTMDPPAAVSKQPAATLGPPQPLAAIGRPVPVSGVAAPYMPGSSVVPVTYTDNAPASLPPGAIIRCEAPNEYQPLSGPPPAPPPPPPPSPYGEPYN